MWASYECYSPLRVSQATSSACVRNLALKLATRERKDICPSFVNIGYRQASVLAKPE